MGAAGRSTPSAEALSPATGDVACALCLGLGLLAAYGAWDPSSARPYADIKWMLASFAMVLALAFAAWNIRRPPSRLPLTLVLLAGFVFWTVASLSWVKAPAIGLADAAGWVTVLSAAALGWLMTIRTNGGRPLVAAFALAGVLNGIAALVQAAAQGWAAGGMPPESSLVGFVGYHNALAASLLLTLPFLALSFAESRGRLRWSAVLGFLLVAGALVLCRSRAALLGFVLQSAFLAPLLLPSRSRGGPMRILEGVAAAALLAATSILWLGTPEGGMRDRTVEDLSGRISGRNLVWRASAGMIREQPVLGTGVGGVAYHVMEAQGRIFEREDPADFLPVTDLTRYAHNEVLHAAVETGLFGALLFATALLWIGWRLWNGGRGMSGTDGRLRRCLLAAGAGVFPAVMLDFPFHLPATAVGIAVVLGMASGLEQEPRRGLPTRYLLPLLAAAALAAAWGFGSQWLSGRALSEASEREPRGSSGVEGLYDRAIKLSLCEGEPAMMKGVFLMEHGRWEEAEGVLEDSLRTWQHPETYERLGNLYGRAGRHEQAAECYRTARGAGVNYIRATSDMARQMALAGRPEEAMAEVERVFRARPRNPRLLRTAGGIAFLMRRPGEAVSYLENAQGRLEYGDRVILGSAYLLERRTADARRVLQDCLKERPDDARVLHHLAALSLAEGDHGGAEGVYRRILEIDPGNAEARAGLVKLGVFNSP